MTPRGSGCLEQTTTDESDAILHRRFAMVIQASVQSAVSEYDVFWQLWPQLDVTGGERRLVGLEVELIGSHSTDRNHIDPACPGCHRVRCVLLDIGNRPVDQTARKSNGITHDIDSHENSILCLPALGSRSAVSVSINCFWTDTTHRTLETELLTHIKEYLAECGIHQR